VATIHFEGGRDEATTINASKPFTTFHFSGFFLLDIPLIFKGGGRTYRSTGAILQRQPGATLPFSIQVVDADDPPQPWDWFKRCIPKPIRRFLHIWMVHEVGATVTGFIIQGDGEGAAFRLSPQ
jgi:hypothetical protein